MNDRAREFPDFDDPRLDDLLTRWLTGDLADEEFATLNSRLESDRDARNRLREMAILDDLLQDMPAPEDDIPAPQAAPSLPIWGLFGGPGATASFLAFTFCLVLLSGWWIARQRGSMEPSPASPRATETLVAGTDFRLDSGVAKLALPGVGSMVIEGPADLEFVNPLLARLRKGRIKMRVTDASGIGFKVETPYGSVTDLGTEFGVSITDDHSADLVVFEGEVDLQVAGPVKGPDPSHVERLEQGDGVRFGEGGRLDRIMSIITGPNGTFEKARDRRNSDGGQPVIVSVWDARRTSDTKKFYEIVPGGMREDAVSYVDRRHEWNGLTEQGMPSYLIGADYVKTFCDDKIRTDVGVRVRLSCPARLYVFFDDALDPPQWLTTEFQKTDDHIGMDLDKWHWPGAGKGPKRADGAGVSVDHKFDIWVRTLTKPGTVQIGPNLNRADDRLWPYMYGIAAVPLDRAEGVAANDESQRTSN